MFAQSEVLRMANLPYISSPGNIDRALNGIKSAAVPDRVSQDFVKTILKIPGGSGDQMTAFLKKLGLANSDGAPSELYRKFRNPASSGAAIAGAIKSAYAPLYVRNEFMHELNDADLLGLVVEETGQAHDSTTVRLTVSCIKHLKAFANFQGGNEPQQAPLVKLEPPRREEPPPAEVERDPKGKVLGFNLGYTINLNLPATSDAAVFDAIFKSLKQHLLRDEDV
jgi:Family of unknown function (DUF5343)